MSFVLGRVGEEFVAIFASVFLLQSVDIAMTDEVVLRRKALPANIARKGSFARVST